MTMIPAGQPGHGTTVSLRRQPVRIVAGKAEGGYTDAFEIVCCDCGDRPDLDYSQVPLRLQQIRGPYTLEAGLAAFERHLGIPEAIDSDRLSGAPPSPSAGAGDGADSLDLQPRPPEP